MLDSKERILRQKSAAEDRKDEDAAFEVGPLPGESWVNLPEAIEC
jgi:hypothetical protein